MRADQLRQVLRIPAMLVLVALLAGMAAVGKVYVGYCERYGFARYTRALVAVISHGGNNEKRFETEVVFSQGTQASQ